VTPDAPGDGRGSDPVDLLDVGFLTVLRPPPQQVSGVMSSSAAARSGRSTSEWETRCYHKVFLFCIPSVQRYAYTDGLLLFSSVGGPVLRAGSS